MKFLNLIDYSRTTDFIDIYSQRLPYNQYITYIPPIWLTIIIPGQVPLVVVAPATVVAMVGRKGNHQNFVFSKLRVYVLRFQISVSVSGLNIFHT
jgi:hypothetical protein